jgi:hypothetical protein
MIISSSKLVLKKNIQHLMKQFLSILQNIKRLNINKKKLMNKLLGKNLIKLRETKMKELKNYRNSKTSIN